MSKEIKKTEKPELAEQDLDQVAGGKTYVRTRSNTLSVEPPPPPAPKVIPSAG